jgi:hypothetical protein
MRLLSAIGGGVAGATVLTLLHETIRKLIPEAPRMDQLGMEAISKTLQSTEIDVPEEDTLFEITMAGDMISNSLYYSLAAIGDEKKGMIRGALLGLAAGFGAVYLPKPLGLNPEPSNRTAGTRLMTVGLYLAGGLAASATGLLLERYQNKRD